MSATKRIVFLALMVSQALILSIVESWLPVPAVVPGVKLGLANIIIMVVIVFFGWKDALAVVFVRCILSSIFGGGFIIFLFSITGGVLSTLIMALMYVRFSKVFSLIGISVAGSVAHNIGQLIVASIIMKQLLVVAYFPVLMISAIVMGVFVGLCSHFLSNALRKTAIL